MRIRLYSPEDEVTLRGILSEQEMGWDWPDMNTPLMLVKLTAVDTKGNPRAAVFVRLTSEMFAIVDPSMTQDEKKEAFKLGLEEAERRLLLAGGDEIHAWIPPKMNGMGKVLCNGYGFEPDEWKSYFKQLGVNNGQESSQASG